MGSFNSDLFKAHLRLAIARLKHNQSKQAAINRSTRAEIAELLRQDRLEAAKVKTKHLVRQDYLLEAYEQLEADCEDLARGIGLIAMSPLDEGLVPAAAAIVYAAPRLDSVPELTRISEDLQGRFGRALIESWRGQESPINHRLIMRLSMRLPDERLIERYLRAIADSFGIQLKGEGRDDTFQQLDEQPPPYTVTVAMPLNQEQTTVRPIPHTVPDFNDIARRFAELKRK